MPQRKPPHNPPEGTSRSSGGAVGGADFIVAIEAYLASVGDWSAMKVTVEEGSRLRIFVARCCPLQGFLSVLGQKAFAAELDHQHDALLRLWNHAYLGGCGTLDVPLPHPVPPPLPGEGIPARGRIIHVHDIVEGPVVGQFKTRSNVSVRGVAGFLRYWLPAIRQNAPRVSRWWLAFLWKLWPPKSRKGREWFGYLVLVEVEARHALGAPDRELAREATKLVQQAQAKVKREDKIQGFLVPVKNVWVVDRLREQLKEKDQALAEKDKEHAAALAEKDKEHAAALAEKDKVLADLRKRLEIS